MKNRHNLHSRNVGISYFKSDIKGQGTCPLSSDQPSAIKL